MALSVAADCLGEQSVRHCTATTTIGGSGGGGGGEVEIHTRRVAFRHLPPNSARICRSEYISNMYTVYK